MIDGKNSKLASPFSTGGGGFIFENRVQASFAILMLSSGYAPCLPKWPIVKIELQAKRLGYDTDDVVITVRRSKASSTAKLLCQVKHSISITKGNKDFEDVINGAWADFNNNQVFQKGIDKIALITGPLNRTDLEIRQILEWARTSPDETHFFEKAYSRISSKNKMQKLDVIRDHLKNANHGNNVADKETWEFLKSFSLLNFDLDIESGVNLSLIHTIIGQYGIEGVNDVWTRIIDVIQTYNQTAGTIKRDMFPDDLVQLFSRPSVVTVPDNLIEEATKPTTWSGQKHSMEIALSMLIGAWSEKYQKDKEVIEAIANEPYADFVAKIREGLSDPSYPLSFENGVWSTKNRLDSWIDLSSLIFDDHMHRFNSAALDVLKEIDPKFDLPSEDRHAAPLFGKMLSASVNLRSGIANALALIGSYSAALINCSEEQKGLFADEVVNQILSFDDWRLWATLDPVMPILAEASPSQFLDALDAHESLITNLFAEERGGIFGSNYLTGVLWGLENLAWSPDYLSRVAITLGNLTMLDPGGNYGNRPVNSLVDIFLPWLPHTTADIEKRFAALRALILEVPDAAWKLLIWLLPNQTSVSSGTHKPFWRDFKIPAADNPVKPKEYWSQIEIIGEMIIELAPKDLHRLTEIVGKIEDLPANARNRLLDILKATANQDLTENDRFMLWDSLSDQVLRHRRFSESKWALPEDTIGEIEAIGNLFIPSDISISYRRLFSGRSFEYLGDDVPWKTQQSRLNEERAKAVLEIFSEEGFAGVQKFSITTDGPRFVGYSLARVKEDNEDPSHVRKALDNPDPKVQDFIDAFVWERYVTQGESWLESLNYEEWPIATQVKLLLYLPFISTMWELACTVLGSDENLYWERVNVRPAQSENNLNVAIAKLLAYSRPLAAIYCMYTSLRAGKPIDPDITVAALVAAASTDETIDQMSSFYIKGLIQNLQSRGDVSEENMIRVEWLYFPHFNSELSPALLEYKLADDPKIYSELIRMIYRPKDSDDPRELSEKERGKATNAYRILQSWSIPPGTKRDGEFDGDAFTAWLDEMVEICTDTGHLGVALSQLGKVLINVPPDSDGFWINKKVAEILNRREMERLLRGYSIGVYNSRGVHFVDPSAKPEDELARNYRELGASIESLGFYRFARGLNQIAEGYERDAERIRKDHQDQD